jgi:hypothetical protein
MLLLEGLSSDYETVMTVIGMTDDASTRGMLHQQESKLRTRKQAKKEQAILFTTAQQSFQAQSPYTPPTSSKP